jgi:protein NirF
MAASSSRRTTRRAASRPSTPRRWNCSPKCRPSTRRGKFSKVVGLADVPGNKFRLRAVRRRRDLGQRFQRSENSRDPALPGRPAALRRAGDAGWPLFPGRPVRRGRRRLLDLWQPEKGARKILENYGRGEEKLPVFKMPHLRGWSWRRARPTCRRSAATRCWWSTRDLEGSRPHPGRASRCSSWRGPDGRQIWVNFAFPDNGWVEVIDTWRQGGAHAGAGQGHPAHGIHAARRKRLAFGARRQQGRDLRHRHFRQAGRVSRQAPSGIFFTSRAVRIGF